MVGCRAKQVEPLQLCRATHRVLVQHTCKVVGYFSRPTVWDTQPQLWCMVLEHGVSGAAQQCWDMQSDD